jgi:DNA modification methylase
MNYTEFLKTKEKRLIETGFEHSGGWEWLYPFQQHCVKLALKKGRYALFEDCGLGKTRQQITWANEVVKHTGKPVLILAPLAVVGQTIAEGNTIGIEVIEYTANGGASIYISNYEQLDNIDCSIFSGVVLDESSILKNYSGAIKQQVIECFMNTPFKLACTATPSPNDELEIGNHAEFLQVMTSQDMRAMFFTTDKNIIKGEKYRLKKYAIKAFYKWISTWALMISRPSDIGFDDTGYCLPKLKYIEKNIITGGRDNGLLFNSVSVSATDFNGELRLTKLDRIEQAAEIANSTKEQYIIWIKHNEEGELLRKLIPDAIEVSGSDTNDYKRKHLLGFANNDFRVLITKNKIAQYGLNYQNCHNQIFAALDFSFESLYQSIRRSYRFGQKEIVNIYLITTDTMQNVISSINEKEEKFIQMQTEMRQAIMQHSEHAEVANTDTVIADGQDYKLIMGDCVAEVRKLKDNSIDYSFFSPPFGALYVFSNDDRDMSNVKNNEEFLKHFSFLVAELYRTIKEGRLCTIHMMQSTTLLGRDGYYSIVDFRGDLIRLFQSHGFHFHAENMIRKDPKTAAIRTKNRQLMHGTTKKDSAIVRPGLADYMLTFKKPGENKVPIRNNIPFDLWCKIAEPVWIDVEEGDTLEFRSAKDHKDERHLTPTQLTPIKWLYMMYTNKGDTVLSPFSGIASEGVQALVMDRKYIGIELKKSYFDISIKNLNKAILSKNQAELFS